MLKNRFFKNALGIEFRKDSLVAVCLRKDLTGIKLVSSISIPSGYDPFNEDEMLELRRFIAQHRIDTKNVSVSIPAEWSLVKFMDIPSAGEDAINQLLHYELERHIPFSLEDVYHASHIVERGGDRCRIVTVVVQRERIEQINEFLKKLSLQPSIITVSSFSILNSIALSGYSTNILKEISGLQKPSKIFGSKKDVCVVLFMEQDNWDMAVIKNGSCIDLRRINLDSGRMDSAWENIAHEMSSALSGFSVQKADRLVISGQLAPEHLRFISDKAGMPVKIIKELPVSVHNANNSDADMLMPSVGACLAGYGLGSMAINILPDKSRLMTKSGPFIAKLSAAAILLLSVWLAVSGINKENRSIEVVEKEIKKNEPELRAVEAISSELSSLEKQKNFFNSVRENSVSKLSILAELTNIIPADAWVTYLTYKEIKNEESSKEKGANKVSAMRYEGEVIINGFANSSAKLISLLENSPLFENVEFISPVTKGMQGEGSKIKAIVVKPGRKEADKKQ